MSRDYPDHSADCICSGCYTSNVVQRTRNTVLDEAAAYAATWARYAVDDADGARNSERLCAASTIAQVGVGRQLNFTLCASTLARA